MAGSKVRAVGNRVTWLCGKPDNFEDFLCEKQDRRGTAGKWVVWVDRQIQVPLRWTPKGKHELGGRLEG